MDQSPCPRLQPIVDLLIAGGNRTPGWMNSQGGWYCPFDGELDLDAVRRSGLLPREAEVLADAVFDRVSWCIVQGPLAG